MPSSKMKVGLAKILKAEGYIADYVVADAPDGEPGQTLTLKLKYGARRERALAGLRRISKPGLRVYARSTGLPKVLGGMGIAIISTSQGLMTDKQAHEKSVGGEVLAYVW
jgi:small subunit ribosomal protein S8